LLQNLKMFTAFILSNYKWGLDISKVKKENNFLVWCFSVCRQEIYFTKLADLDLQLNQVVIIEH